MHGVYLIIKAICSYFLAIAFIVTKKFSHTCPLVKRKPRVSLSGRNQWIIAPPTVFRRIAMATEQKKDPSVAESRSRRAQAGRNIGKLIDQEQDADDFYKTAYGGFSEESADEEYEVRHLFLSEAHQ